jgi:hypothetical protein
VVIGLSSSWFGWLEVAVMDVGVASAPFGQTRGRAHLFVHETLLSVVDSDEACAGRSNGSYRVDGL